MPDVFVSYSRKDQEYVRDLVDALAERRKEVWADWKDIAPTMEFLEEIRAGIEGSDAVVFVISPDSADSEVCREEVVHAERLSKRILPVLRRDVDARALPLAVAMRQWIFSREQDDLAAAVDELVRALDTDFDWTRRHTELLEKALEWDRHNRDSSYLLHGSELRAAEQWLAQPGAASKEPPPSPLHSEYLFASRQAADRRQRIVIAGVSVALVVAVALAVVAVIQRGRAISERQTAVSQLAASEALRRMDTRLDEALLLAVASYRVKHTPQARHALATAVHRSRRVEELLRPGGGRAAAAVSPDGRLLAVAEASRVVVRRMAAPAAIATFTTGPHADALAFSRDGRLLAAVAGGRLVVWRLGEGRIRGLPAAPRASALAFSPASNALAVGTEEGKVSVWEPGRGRLLGLEAGGPVTSLAFSPDGRTLAIGGNLGAFLASVAAPARVTGPRTVSLDVVRDVRFASRSELVVVLGDGNMFVWDIRRAGVRCAPALPPLAAVAADRKGRLVAGAQDGRLLVFPAPCGALAETLRGHGDEISALTVPADGSRIVSGGLDGLVAVWQTGAAPLSDRLPTGVEPLVDAAFGWESGTIVAGGEGGAVLVRRGSPPQKLRDAPSYVLGTATASRGRVVAAVGGGSGVVWSGARYVPATLRPPPGGATPLSVALGPDGTLSARGTDRGTVVVERRGRRPLLLDTGARTPVAAVAIGREGSVLAAGTADGAVVVWELEAEPRRTVVQESGASISALAFDPARPRLAVGGDGDAVTLWDVDSARLVASLPGHRTGVADIGFSPDGRTIATTDGVRIFLWDGASLRTLGDPILPVDGSVSALEFDAEGGRLAAPAEAGSVLVLPDVFWEPEPGIERLCPLVDRSLSASAWREIAAGADLPETC